MASEKKKVKFEKKAVPRQRRRVAMTKGSKPGFSPFTTTLSGLTISAAMAALQPKLTTMPKSTSLLPHDSDDEMVVIRDDEKKRSSGDEKKEQMMVPLGALKGLLFKRDQPYRTTLPLQGGFFTTAGGTVNITQSCSSIASVSEWASIDALFDEIFIHEMRFRFFPVNNLGGGVGVSNSAGITGGITAIASTTIVNAPLLMVALFNGGATYSTASAMAANATLAVHSSSMPFQFKWLNNVMFDRRGTNANLAGWQGWTPIADVSNYGGQIQFRAMQDSIIGTGSALVTMGSYLCQYDVSFRARS